MQILSKRTLREFWQRYPQAEAPLTAWHKIVSSASWKTPHETKETFRSADFLKGNRVIFDIGGNKFRLVAYVAFHPYYRVLVKFVGTHEEYDRIDPETV